MNCHSRLKVGKCCCGGTGKVLARIQAEIGRSSRIFAMIDVLPVLQSSIDIE
jgi:hypothetical protein